MLFDFHDGMCRLGLKCSVILSFFPPRGVFIPFSRRSPLPLLELKATLYSNYFFIPFFSKKISSYKHEHTDITRDIIRRSEMRTKRHRAKTGTHHGHSARRSISIMFARRIFCWSTCDVFSFCLCALVIVTVISMTQNDRRATSYVPYEDTGASLPPPEPILGVRQIYVRLVNLKLFISDDLGIN